MVPQPPAIHSPSSTQYTQQFLSNVLSQRGPSSFPYSEDVKWLIRQHLVSLADTFPSLQPKTATFTHNNGLTVNLLQSNGTVPMLYQDVTYNIPVIIWLMVSYPRQAPLVFVNPTPDMVIKRPHPFVDPSGIVSIPYLTNWVYPSSNLAELARNLSQFFSRDPPLFTRPRPNPHPPQSTSFSSSGSTRPAIPSRVYPQSPYGSGSGAGGVGGRVMDDPWEMYKRSAIDDLVVKLHSDIEGLRRTREADMEGLFSAQGVLRRREEELRKGVKEMLDEKEGLEQQLQMVLMNTDVLEGWVRDNEAKVKKIGNVNVDEVFEPFDSLSKQMSDCTASDLAMEDVIYALDKAIQEGAIPFDQYLRNVRLLSREQFIHRATASKVKAAQMQAQVDNMASRLSQYALS
ncbi:hypothetical protein HAX54_039767 [Datura stramonium]|uniref:Protein ELC-like n=1 Tax=Datura stramonium TaxID=4076 RepID=A0ABS8SJD3_DATST|nr:hypothetical protein [Datura stramonium]